MLLKLHDICIITITLCAIVVSFFFVYATGEGNSIIALKAQNGEWVYPIDANEILLVSGPLGDTVVEIREKGARISASPCLNQTCVAAGIVHLPGQWTACLPNRVMVYISKSMSSNESVDGNEVDATVW
jgi:hypothetical protein